jgi:hypothetical protein
MNNHDDEEAQLPPIPIGKTLFLEQSGCQLDCINPTP